MVRTALAVALTALTAASAAGACVAPLEPMPFDLWSGGPKPHIIYHKGDCVIDPGIWIYTPPPHHTGGRRRPAM